MPTEGDAVELWTMEPTAAALVMGSSQQSESFSVAELERDGIELAGRRSGGGAVFIDPAQTVWVDVVAPRSSWAWSADLTETFRLVGERWQRALRERGVEADLCVQAPTREPASALACWAGIGWGELTVEGSKVVGLSQRRTRWGARIQGMAVLDASSARVIDYVAPALRPVLANAIPTAHAAQLASAGVTKAGLETAVVAALLEIGE